MAAFSRGFFRCPSCSHNLPSSHTTTITTTARRFFAPPSRSLTPRRTFTSSPSNYANLPPSRPPSVPRSTKPKKTPPPPTTTTKPAASPGPLKAQPYRSATVRSAILDELAKGNVPVQIYESGGHRFFTASALATGSTLLGAGVLSVIWYTQLFEQEGLGVWLRPTYAVMAALFVGLGGYILVAPMRLVRSVAVVPARVVAGHRAGEAMVQAEVRTLMPFRKGKVVSAQVGQMYTTKQYWLLAQDLRMVTDRVEAQKAYLQSMYRGKGVWMALKSIPHYMNVAMFTWYHHTRKRLLREGIVYVKKDGKTIGKMDVSSGRMLSDRRAMETLLPIRGE